MDSLDEERGRDEKERREREGEREREREREREGGRDTEKMKGELKELRNMCTLYVATFCSELLHLFCTAGLYSLL